MTMGTIMTRMLATGADQNLIVTDPVKASGSGGSLCINVKLDHVNPEDDDRHPEQTIESERRGSSHSLIS